MLQVVKRSLPYRRLHRRLVSPQPSDSWVEGEVVYVVFDLMPTDPVAACPPLALFVVHRHQQVVLLRLVIPNASGTGVEISAVYQYQGGVSDGIV